MLRSLTRCALPRRSVQNYSVYSFRRHIILKPALVHTRLLSTPQSSTDTNTSKNSSDYPPSSLQQRKPKVGLRPAPIKPTPQKPPSTLSAHHVPLSPSSPVHKLPPTSSTSPTLNEVKETAKRDIEAAEAHGILTPPPPDANWFKRTMHKGIQLAVCFRNISFPYDGTFMRFYRNSTTGVSNSSSCGVARLSKFVLESKLVAVPLQE